MKKILTWMLLAMLVVSMCGLSACKKEAEETGQDVTTDADAGDGMIDGGWEVADIPETELPEEVKAAFDKALETLTGSYADVRPVAYLASQVVAGTNYEVLCRVTYADESVPAGLVVLTVYADLEGNAEILSAVDLYLADFNFEGDNSAPIEMVLTGGWELPETVTTTDIPEEAKAAFEKAAAGLMGNDLTPMALLGTQVVAGTNYMFLCRSSLVTEEPVESLQVVVVYEDLEGNATISSIATLDPANYVNN